MYIYIICVHVYVNYGQEMCIQSIHVHVHALYSITYMYESIILYRYLDAIERAVSNGDTLLLESIGESVDPVLDPLLGRLTIKKGKYIKIGDKEVEFHPKLRSVRYDS